jgi:hypothetical protein
MIVDQAVIKAGFDFRRYAMKPTPAKPRIIIAHVEGSGTAPTLAPDISKLVRVAVRFTYSRKSPV